MIRELPHRAERLLSKNSLVNHEISMILTSFFAQRDAFQKREKASEDYAVKQREREKLVQH